MRVVGRSGIQLVVAASALLVVVGCLVTVCARPCRNDERYRVRSPDGRYEAIVFERDCGATTAESLEISMVQAGSRLGSGPGNILRLVHPADLRVEWLAPDRLSVSHAAGAQVGAKETAYKDVIIEYEVMKYDSMDDRHARDG
jgi:hypothetical protein